MSSVSSNGSETFERTIALFREASVAAYVKRTVALFAMIGVGVGFAGYLTISLLLSGEGILNVTLGFVLGMIVLLLVSCLGAALAAVIATQARTTTRPFANPDVCDLWGQLLRGRVRDDHPFAHGHPRCVPPDCRC